MATGRYSPHAVTQSKTNNARFLQTLYSWQGRIYSGYGSIDNSRDGLPYEPLRIIPFDPQTETFVISVPPITTESYFAPIYREIGSGNVRGRVTRLATPYGDALDFLDTRNFSFTRYDGDGSVWQIRTSAPMYHVYDIARLTESDVWIVGSGDSTRNSSDPNVCIKRNEETGKDEIACSDAMVFRSTDRGATFTQSLVVPPIQGHEVSRFYFAGVLNNKLYVQSRDLKAGGPFLKQNVSWVFDGNTNSWSTGPNLLPGTAYEDDYGYQPIQFNNRMVYMTRLAASNNRKDLMVFDGTTAASLATPAGVANFTVGGGYLYVLASDGAVRRTNDLTRPYAQWESTNCFPILDANTGLPAGRSIAVLNGAIYIGTSDATLYKLDSFVLSSDPCPGGAPPPSNGSSSDSL